MRMKTFLNEYIESFKREICPHVHKDYLVLEFKKNIYMFIFETPITNSGFLTKGLLTKD